jgi:hypothetical protein
LKIDSKNFLALDIKSGKCELICVAAGKDDAGPKEALSK